MFGWEFPPFNSGGLGVACAGLSRALTQKGVEIIFVLPKQIRLSNSPGRFVFADELIPDIFKRKVAVNSLLTPYATPQSYRNARAEYAEYEPYGNDLFFEVRRYGRAGALIASRETFDIIHAHDWLSSVAGIAAKKASGKPLIVHVHATEYDRTGGEHPHPEVCRLEKEGFEAADLILAVSRFTKDQVIHRYGISPHKIQVCYNGIEQASVPAAAQKLLPLKLLNKKVVLFVGRLTLQKGPDYFLQAAELVASYEPDAFFVIAGSGDMERQIIAQSVGLGLQNRLAFAGFLRGEELRGVYASADVFVLPSVSEPFGLTALEAAEAGVPVVLSKQSGVAELLRHCFKVDFWDVREMAAKIVALLRYPALREAISAGAKGDAARSTWERSAERCIGLYEKLIPTPAL